MAEANWTEDQVASLNAYQDSGQLHPFTCNCGRNLVAGPRGWFCSGCSYTQDWCHAWMANWSWKEMLLPLGEPD